MATGADRPRVSHALSRRGLKEGYDYIIVGAGSAGCVLAERLSADPRHRVLVIEAGGSDRSPLITMPKGMAKLVLDPAYAWQYPVVSRGPSEVSIAWRRAGAEDQ